MKQGWELLFRRAWVLALQTGILGFGLLPVFLLGGIAEALGPWWLYGLAVVGSWVIASLLLQMYRYAEVKLKVLEDRYKAVPVPRIARRSLVRKGRSYGVSHKTCSRGSAESIAKSFESLCGRHSRWQIWADWIAMCAYSISNAVDRAHREEREEMYLTLRKKYTEAEAQTMGEMLGMAVAALDENPDQDLLGEIFMTLGLGNEHNGQFFTPYNVCRAMSELTIGDIAAQVEAQGWVSVADPACGAGALLVAFANECRRPGHDINFQTSVLFVGQDIDYIVGLMCYIQLSLLGCAGYIVIGDTLAHPSTAYDRRGLIPRDEGNVWYTPMYFRDVWHWRRLWAQMDLMCRPEEGKNAPQPAQQAQKKAALPPEPTKPIFAENKNGQLTLF